MEIVKFDNQKDDAEKFWQRLINNTECTFYFFAFFLVDANLL